MYRFKYEIKNIEGLNAAICYPRSYKTGEKYPLIIALHGAGTRGNDPEAMVSGSRYLQLMDDMENFPFISILPQCHEDTWFDLWESLERFFKVCCARDDVDPTRVYVMGASMGGYATWQLGMSLPELIAAIAPICGGGMYWNAGRLKNVPVWAFHGGKDTTVFPEESQKMVDAVNRKGGNAKLTIFPENGHDAWTDSYGNPELYKWFLEHTNFNAPLVKEFTDSEIYG